MAAVRTKVKQIDCEVELSEAAEMPSRDAPETFGLQTPRRTRWSARRPHGTMCVCDEIPGENMFAKMFNYYQPQMAEIDQKLQKVSAEVKAKQKTRRRRNVFVSVIAALFVSFLAAAVVFTLSRKKQTETKQTENLIKYSNNLIEEFRNMAELLELALKYDGADSNMIQELNNMRSKLKAVTILDEIPVMSDQCTDTWNKLLKISAEVV
ncbi:uncharacterized protein LOC115051917 [Echeneis naucrates]|uniref:uncharacterized protein LOC115051917 n=1 Tax=Echeneis naucrates TaxID=173247 RepID=UPI0011133E88|nr:uncharacterized protein LOC115051917 [Echeneis naucrates]